VNLEYHHHALSGKAELRVVGIDKASGLRIPLEIIAAIGTAEELLLEGALQDVAAHLEFYGVRGRYCACQEQKSARQHS